MVQNQKGTLRIVYENKCIHQVSELKEADSYY